MEGSDNENLSWRGKFSKFFNSRAGMATLGIISAIIIPTLALCAKLIG